MRRALLVTSLALFACSSGTRSARVELDLSAMMSVVDAAAASGSLPESMRVPGVDPAVLLWSVLRDEAGGDVARQAEAKLRELGKAHVLERGVARILLDGKGAAELADGTRLDWAPGQPTSAPRAEAELDFAGEGGTIVAGQPIRLRVRVANVGKGSLHQLHAITRSEVEALDGVLVLFGRVAPGEKRERVLELATPQVFSGDAIAIALQFTEANGYVPPETAGRVAVRGAPRPVLAISVVPYDDGSGQSVGNGDGVVQRGEAVDLVIGVQNTGNAAASAATLSLDLPRDAGIAVFGGPTHELGALAPGARAEVRVNISVKPTFTGAVVPIRAHASERSAFAYSTDSDLSLRIDQQAPRQVIRVDRPLVVAATTPLLSAASADARPLGNVEKGSRLRAVGEIGGFVQVEYTDASGQSKRAWLAATQVSYDVTSVPAIQVGNAAIVREKVNAPPFVAFLTPAEGVVTNTSETSVEIKATVKDEEGIAEITLLVNDAPLAGSQELMRGLKAKQEPVSGAKLVNVARPVPLQPGQNRIALVVKDTEGETRTAQVIVERSVREANVVALVVGIDGYDDPEIPALRFAEADARAVADFLRGPRSPVRNPDDVKVLLGKEATATNIRVWLDRHLVARAAHPEDMAIFYFAGHGFSNSERYYLAGSDTVHTSLRATAIRESELQELWRDIRAERKLFIADACHSGGLKGMRGDNAIATGLLAATSVKQGKGRVSILASRGAQQSVELEERGHGAFTFALLQGLAGRADQEKGNRDGRVSVREIVSFLDVEVPALARGVGHEQNPMYEVTEAEGDVHITR